MPQIILNSGTTSFPDPGDWGPPNSVEIVGWGGSGAASYPAQNPGGVGGGGGAYAVGQSIAPTFPVTITFVSYPPGGGSTSFGTFVSADNGVSGNWGQNSGAPSGGINVFPAGYRGGNGGASTQATGTSGPGGGGAGPMGIGGNGGANVSPAGYGNGGSTPAPPGSFGAAANSYPSLSTLSSGWNVGSGGMGTNVGNPYGGTGGTCGGGGGGGSAATNSTGGAGGPGIIVIVYTTVVPTAGSAMMAAMVG